MQSKSQKALGFERTINSKVKYNWFLQTVEKLDMQPSCPLLAEESLVCKDSNDVPLDKLLSRRSKMTQK